MLENDRLQNIVEQRYAKWQKPIGQKIMAGSHNLDSLAQYTIEQNTEPTTVSGQQELCENIVNQFIWDTEQD